MQEFRPPASGARFRFWLAVAVAVAGIVPLVAVGSLVWTPVQVEYVVADGVLTISPGGWFDGERRVEVGLVASVRPVDAVRGRRRVGTVMPGYCVGRFHYESLGTVWQATDCGREAVLLEVRGEDLPWLVTPPRRADFIARLSAGGGYSARLPIAPRGWFHVAMAALVLAGVTTLAAVIALLKAGPSRLVYLVGDGRLEVRTLFTRREWNAAELHAHRHSPRRWLRLMGSSVPGYHTGLFRLDGARTRVYAAHRGEGVLLEGAERVFLTPEDADAFLAALHAHGTVIE